ncbi:recombination protein RecR [Pseudoclavibacter endophyticus]|uniref:Recombination protein RecR n=1 Tax=Pseudoclavibacter endophyticus TaxID=1778590 RepID=A0A6H9WK57_9MICO|nr:recombination protein RecR [Pseudoclavibacter endophyticus]
MYEGIVQELIDELARLPGVGPKSAQRIAFHIVQTRNFDVTRLAGVLMEVRERIRFCEICGNISEREQCVVCRDPRRDPTIICVVEEPKDVAAIERTREFQGRYHVLGGAISPIEGIGPDDLNIRSLLHRLESGDISEIIVATDPNLEGDATASYLSRLLRSVGVSVSRLASGLPVGGDLEYADEVTLGRAFAGRQAMGDRRSIPTRPAVGGWASAPPPEEPTPPPPDDAPADPA